MGEWAEEAFNDLVEVGEQLASVASAAWSAVWGRRRRRWRRASASVDAHADGGGGAGRRRRGDTVFGRRTRVGSGSSGSRRRGRRGGGGFTEAVCRDIVQGGCAGLEAACEGLCEAVEAVGQGFCDILDLAAGALELADGAVGWAMDIADSVTESVGSLLVVNRLEFTVDYQPGPIEGWLDFDLDAVVFGRHVVESVSLDLGSIARSLAAALIGIEQRDHTSKRLASPFDLYDADSINWENVADVADRTATAPATSTPSDDGQEPSGAEQSSGAQQVVPPERPPRPVVEKAPVFAPSTKGNPPPPPPKALTLDDFPSLASQPCWAGDGRYYRGTVDRTASGRRCQAWTAQAPHAHSFLTTFHPHAGLGAHAYCRNPDGSGLGGQPWCITTDPAVFRARCDVPSCQGGVVLALRREHADGQRYVLSHRPSTVRRNGLSNPVATVRYDAAWVLDRAGGGAGGGEEALTLTEVYPGYWRNAWRVTKRVGGRTCRYEVDEWVCPHPRATAAADVSGVEAGGGASRRDVFQIIALGPGEFVFVHRDHASDPRHYVGAEPESRGSGGGGGGGDGDGGERPFFAVARVLAGHSTVPPAIEVNSKS